MRRGNSSSSPPRRLRQAPPRRRHPVRRARGDGEPARLPVDHDPASGAVLPAAARADAGQRLARSLRRYGRQDFRARPGQMRRGDRPAQPRSDRRAQPPARAGHRGSSMRRRPIEADARKARNARFGGTHKKRIALRPHSSKVRSIELAMEGRRWAGRRDAEGLRPDSPHPRRR